MSAQEEERSQQCIQTIKYCIPVQNQECEVTCEYTPAAHVVDLRLVQYAVPSGVTNLYEYTQYVFNSILTLGVGSDTRVRTILKSEDGITTTCEVKKKGAAKAGQKKRKCAD